MSAIDSTARGSLVQRMVRAARLDVDVYEEVEADRSATNSALMAVMIVAVATGIGAALAFILAGDPGRAAGALISQIVGSVIGWVVWAYVTYFIGTKLFSGRATPGEMLRTIGFAQSPGVFNILGFVPGLGVIIAAVISVWMLVAGVVAVRQALDFSTGKAILTTIVGWLAIALITTVLGLVGYGVSRAIV